MKNSRKFVSAGLMYLVLIIIFIVAMFPVLYTILGSFKGNMELLASNGKLLPEKFVFDNYKQAWEFCKVYGEFHFYGRNYCVWNNFYQYGGWLLF